MSKAVVGPQVSGGLSIYRKVDLGVTGQVAKATPGMLYGLVITNAAAAIRYVKIYNKATAPTEADTPAMTLKVAASSYLVMDPATMGLEFSAGISARGTTGVADNDTGAPTANDIIVSLFYK